MPFALSVHAFRSGHGILRDGRIVLTAKYIVRANVHQQAPYLFHGHSQVLHRLCVQELGGIGMAFRGIYVGVASAVHNHIYALGGHHRPYCCKVRNVQQKGVRGVYHVRENGIGHHPTKAHAQLAATSCD